MQTEKFPNAERTPRAAFPAVGVAEESPKGLGTDGDKPLMQNRTGFCRPFRDRDSAGNTLDPLPMNVCRHPDGFLIRVRRRGIGLRGFVAYGTPQALDRAVEMRDRFLLRAGPFVPARKSVGKSNTGIAGISETVHWVKYQPRECFTVHLGRKWRPRMKYVYFGPQSRTRAEALEIAKVWRRKVGAHV